MMGGSLRLVANSNGSPERAGASANFRNSSDLLQRYFSPRHSTSLRPLVFQLATEVKRAPGCGGASVFQKSVTIGWRVGIQRKPWAGTGKFEVPTFSPNVKSE